jgi:magnesium chelatase family protein
LNTVRGDSCISQRVFCKNTWKFPLFYKILWCFTGGSPPRPGEISLAHRGILFLDEMPEYPRAALEALREPLESGHITISRAARRHDFPARFQLVAAMNPCPCGHLGNPLKACRCTPDQVNRYQGKLSGPLLDRIDVQVEVPAVSAEVLSQAPDGETSAVVAERVKQARARQWARQGCLNSDLDGAGLDLHAQPTPAAMAFLKKACERLGWSGRGFHRVLRLARTLADLAGEVQIDMPHVAEAIQYRRALQAPAASLASA